MNNVETQAVASFVEDAIRSLLVDMNEFVAETVEEATKLGIDPISAEYAAMKHALSTDWSSGLAELIGPK